MKAGEWTGDLTRQAEGLARRGEELAQWVCPLCSAPFMDLRPSLAWNFPQGGCAQFGCGTWVYLERRDGKTYHRLSGEIHHTGQRCRPLPAVAN